MSSQVLIQAIECSFCLGLVILPSAGMYNFRVAFVELLFAYVRQLITTTYPRTVFQSISHLQVDYLQSLVFVLLKYIWNVSDVYVIRSTAVTRKYLVPSATLYFRAIMTRKCFPPFNTQWLHNYNTLWPLHRSLACFSKAFPLQKWI